MSAPAAPAPEPAPPPAADAELQQALARLPSLLDRSLEGRLDPGAILDAALLVAAHELGAPQLEPDFAGRLVIPVEGMPAGVEATLCVSKPNGANQKVLTLELGFERHIPYLYENFEREGPRVNLTTWTNEGEELQHFSILTDVHVGRRVSTLDMDPPRMTSGVGLYTPLAEPSQWKLTPTGMLEVAGSVQPDGSRSYKSGSWEIPQVLEGGAWPRADDMRRLSRRMLAMLAEAKNRTGR